MRNVYLKLYNQHEIVTDRTLSVYAFASLYINNVGKIEQGFACILKSTLRLNKLVSAARSYIVGFGLDVFNLPWTFCWPSAGVNDRVSSGKDCSWSEV